MYRRVAILIAHFCLCCHSLQLSLQCCLHMQGSIHTARYNIATSSSNSTFCCVSSCILLSFIFTSLASLIFGISTLNEPHLPPPPSSSAVWSAAHQRLASLVGHCADTAPPVAPEQGGESQSDPPGFQCTSHDAPVHSCHEFH